MSFLATMIFIFIHVAIKFKKKKCKFVKISDTYEIENGNFFHGMNKRSRYSCRFYNCSKKTVHVVRIVYFKTRNGLIFVIRTR